MSTEEIAISVILKLTIAIVVTGLVNKLAYFNNSERNRKNSKSKKMIVWGIWIYSVFSIPIFKLMIRMYLGRISVFDYVAYIGLILGIIGLILCIVSNKEKNSEIIEKIMKPKNKPSKTNTDDINLF